VITALLAVPLVAALVLAIAPLGRRWAEGIALMAVLADVALAISALLRFDAGDRGLQLVQDHVWIRDFVGGTDVRYHVAMDGLSLFMVLLTTIGVMAAVATAVWAERERPRAYLGTMLMLEAAVILLFTAQDIVLFYVGWEAMMIPLYILMAVWGGPQRRRTTIQFVVYTLVGSLLMLVGIAVLGIDAGSFQVSGPNAIRPQDSLLLFLAFAVAFLIKAPLFPLHGWLPGAYRQSTPEVTALLSGVISKAGAYGLLRFALPIFPQNAADTRNVFLVLGLIGLLYGSVLAFRQSDARGVVAYSSLGQMSLIVIGIFALNDNGTTGAIFQMVNHGVVSLASFLLIGLIELRVGTDSLRLLGGLANGNPRWNTILLIAALWALAVPGSSTFVSELYVLVGAFQRDAFIGIVGAFAIVLAAMYMLRWYSAIAHGPNGERVPPGTPDLRAGELGIAIPLVLVLIALTVYPFGVMNRVSSAFDRLVAPAASALR
jgi:NADH-quinone oxidoreductase subunit M